MKNKCWHQVIRLHQFNTLDSLIKQQSHLNCYPSIKTVPRLFYEVVIGYFIILIIVFLFASVYRVKGCF